MTPGARLSVVVPAYQEGATIVAALDRLRTSVEKLDTDFEIIVVADGCTDDTAALVRGLDDPTVKLVEYQPNRGKGYALGEGFAASSGDLIAFIDADLDIDPQGIGVLLVVLCSNRADVVVASKVHPDSNVHYPAFRRIQSRVFRLLVRVLFSLSISDSQTGLKLFRREVLTACLPRVRSTGFAFDLELLIAANDSGYKLEEAPVRLDYQFSTTTGALAVVMVLRDTLGLASRRLRSRHLTRGSRR
ncbi:MAG TPA: glycosyltransferase family 2 protein [Acidimicrobiales bacterium]|nr:glycosyltransferase family 2 protein [Acidimicrobiales bacterium]